MLAALLAQIPAAPPPPPPALQTDPLYVLVGAQPTEIPGGVLGRERRERLREEHRLDEEDLLLLMD